MTFGELLNRLGLGRVEAPAGLLLAKVVVIDPLDNVREEFEIDQVVNVGDKIVLHMKG